MRPGQGGGEENDRAHRSPEKGRAGGGRTEWAGTRTTLT